ncbi:MAG TPA: phosphoadenylyl-sulfate reductase [Candidatus Dormibacteraeota bacterium]|nr:phosphoadenylyl-sulfate reductase [Candidatus Dormibacteraeota bacterium]
MRPTSIAEELDLAAASLEGSPAQAILEWAFGRFEKVVLVASFQAESSVLIDLAAKMGRPFEILTLDTGRLPQATHDLIDTVRARYEVPIRLVYPDQGEVAEMTATHGTNLFRQSVANRHLCCGIRKTQPLRRSLIGYDAWLTGLRRDQSPTRSNVPVVQADKDKGGIAKVAPLVKWSHDDVWGYIHEHGLPVNSLYNDGYTSIGCEPCTRATTPGEDERAGRWWWEEGAVKECGINFDVSGNVIPAKHDPVLEDTALGDK